jgi:hypothetical protein
MSMAKAGGKETAVGRYAYPQNYYNLKAAHDMHCQGIVLPYNMEQ